MEVKIRKAEEHDGEIAVELRLGDCTKVHLFLCTTEKKIKGMYKEVLDQQYTDIPEQDIKESEEDMDDYD